MAAEKSGRKIAVEVKSFLGSSDITDRERALGQFVFYEFLLADQEPDRALFLAIPDGAYDVIVKKRARCGRLSMRG